jgi:glutamine synthetase
MAVATRPKPRAAGGPKAAPVDKVRAGTATKDEVVADRRFQEKLRAIRRIIDEKGIEYCYFMFLSVDGKVNGKGAPSNHFEKIAQGGIRHVYGAVCDLRIARNGQYIAFGPEETEFIGIPDLDTFQILSYEHRVARVLCNLYFEDGKPFDADVRGNLQRISARTKQQLGATLMIGIEPELMFLKEMPDGSLKGATEPICYHMRQFETLRPLILDVISNCKAMGLNMIQGDHEDAPGQMEINIQYDTPVVTADNHTTYRMVTYEIAKRHDLLACFMPKPFTGVSASGHHHHFSMWNDKGENIFAAPGMFGLSQTAKYFLGGLLKHAGALTAICAPTVNSYKRFWDVGFWAPVYKSWGYNNRTTLIRCPGAGRYEYRGVDASCNPYLTLAALQVCGTDGVRNKIDPGEAVQESIYDLMEKGTKFEKIPMMLGEAIEAFKADPITHEIMPGKLYDAFLGCRTDDWESFCAAVTDWEREKYLRLFP